MIRIIILIPLAIALCASSVGAEDDAAEKEKLAKEWLKYMEGEWDVKVSEQLFHESRLDISPPNLHASAKLIDNRLVVKFTSPLPYGADKVSKTITELLKPSSTILIRWEPNPGRLTFNRLSNGTAALESGEVGLKRKYPRDSLESSRARHSWVLSEIEADELANTKKSFTRDGTKIAVRKTKAGFVCTHTFVYAPGFGYIYKVTYTRATDKAASVQTKERSSSDDNLQKSQ